MIEINKQYKNKKWLYQKYIVEGLSSYKIAELCNLKRKDSIIRMLNFFEIPKRKSGTKLGTKFSKKHRESISEGGIGKHNKKE